MNLSARRNMCSGQDWRTGREAMKEVCRMSGLGTWVTPLYTQVTMCLGYEYVIVCVCVCTREFCTCYINPMPLICKSILECG